MTTLTETAWASAIKCITWKYAKITLGKYQNKLSYIILWSESDIISRNSDMNELSKFYRNIIWLDRIYSSNLTHINCTMAHSFLCCVHRNILQGRIQGVSCVSMDTVNIIGNNWKKINIYYYYPVRKGQWMVWNYFNVFILVGL